MRSGRILRETRRALLHKRRLKPLLSNAKDVVTACVRRSVQEGCQRRVAPQSPQRMRGLHRDGQAVILVESHIFEERPLQEVEARLQVQHLWE